jgi:integrase
MPVLSAVEGQAFYACPERSRREPPTNAAFLAWLHRFNWFSRLRALVILLRCSGLRIGDAVSLSRDRIADGKLFLYTAKTGTPVYCPLPDSVLMAREASPRTCEKYFFGPVPVNGKARWETGNEASESFLSWRRCLTATRIASGTRSR